ncbi:F0F1 ATP synthase subunit B [Clostridium sp. AL.422]|nr:MULTISPECIES: F0F1 ATP synthase subunit B [unclassified Clostridium]MDV4151593.1 F0F1 ATP synthase subunit B [Clostridium sp. AL.422]
MEINPSTLIATLINFFILFLILKHFFFKKVEAIITEREDLINEQLDYAEEESEKARMIAIENERILKNAREQGKLITEKHKEKAEKVYDEIINDANQEAKKIIERAKIEINREKEKVQDELKRESIHLAIELSKKVIEKNIDEGKNRELIDEFITKVGNS